MSATPSFDHVLLEGCLTIRLRNSDIITNMETTVRAISSLIENQRPRVTLIDFRDVPVPTTFIQRYDLGEMAGRYLGGRQIAALLRPDQADRQQIGKVVAINRGARVEVFTDPLAAEAWIASFSRPGTTE